MPDQRGPQDERAERQRGQGAGDAPAGQVQPHQAQAGVTQEPAGPGRLGPRFGFLQAGGGHGSWARVMWPARSAARWAASQACRVAAGSAANLLAAAATCSAFACAFPGPPPV